MTVRLHLAIARVVAMLLLVHGFVESSNATVIPAPVMAIPIAVNGGGVTLYNINGTGPLTNLPTIPGTPATDVNNPITATFSQTGELFIGNRHNGSPGAGSIARFLVNPDGSATPHGVITGNGLENVHGMAFSSSGELFAANYFASEISRFTFDGSGNPIPNGTLALASGPFPTLGVAFSPWGELFVSRGEGSTPSAVIERYLFDPSGNPIPNGSFTPGSGGPHFLAFSPSGELFVPGNGLNEGVYRYLFDGSHQPIPNGLIPIAGGAVGVAFSPFGEIFVTSQSQYVDGGGMHRFILNPDGSVTPNGRIDTGPLPLGGVAIFPIPEPSSILLAALGFVGVAAWSRRGHRRA